MMPSQSFFLMIAKHYDIRKSAKVVLYDTAGNLFAHRACFMLRCFGHPDVHVLDGGFSKWKADGGKVESAQTIASPADYDFDLVPELVCGFEDVKRLSQENSKQIVDVRPADMFAKGTIPTAINLPQTDLQHADGSIKSDEEIRAVFAAKNVDLTKPIVFSCNSGVRATLALSAAQQVGATGQLAVFDGSWSEWEARNK